MHPIPHRPVSFRERYANLGDRLVLLSHCIGIPSSCIPYAFSWADHKYDVYVAFLRVPDLQTQSISTLGTEFAAGTLLLSSEFHFVILGAKLPRPLPP